MAHTCISWKRYTWSSPCLQMCYPIGAWAPTDTVLTAHLDMSSLVMMVYNYLLDNRPHHLRLNQHRNNTIVHLLRTPTKQNGTTTFSSLCCTSPGQSGNTVLVRYVFYNFCSCSFQIRVFRSECQSKYDNVMKPKPFPHYCPFVLAFICS